jgi:3-hydroxybutyryl-CoA dehydratase
MQSCPYSQVRIGDRIGDLASMTEWHIMTAAALYNDAGPNHVNAQHAASNRFGERIAPGFLTTGIMMGALGRHYGWNIEAFLESHVRFLAPVCIGASLHILWEVTHLEAKTAFSGGIVTLQGWCWSGDPERLAVDMDAKIALNNGAAPVLRSRPR